MPLPLPLTAVLRTHVSLRYHPSPRISALVATLRNGLALPGRIEGTELLTHRASRKVAGPLRSMILRSLRSREDLQGSCIYISNQGRQQIIRSIQVRQPHNRRSPLHSIVVRYAFSQPAGDIFLFPVELGKFRVVERRRGKGSHTKFQQNNTF